jgi:hypothetical protein
VGGFEIKVWGGDSAPDFFVGNTQKKNETRKKFQGRRKMAKEIILLKKNLREKKTSVRGGWGRANSSFPASNR